MSFKKFLHIVFFSFFALISFANTDENEQIFVNGNFAYGYLKYDQAIENYKILIEKGFTARNLNFNLANAYFKTNQIGKSILYYEKVLKDEPKNEDALKNLAFVKTKLDKDLQEIPELFFVSWWNSIVHFFKADTLAWIAIVFSWFAFIAFVYRYFSKNEWLKKMTTIKVYFFVFIAICSFLLMKVNDGSFGVKTEMILTVKQSQAKDAPSENAQNLDIFHEGTKLEILDSIDDFYKTKNDNKEVIWVSKADFEII